ncbi:OLC1v1015420C1 [Oldenlandia corymbosa var. corymbosa]|uniref:OLC1v1015420C1 n=1 Tax=Oldenlandia corymbosa var. corymbosa TaxID=529605 RepID=A0AAV1E360_OLDCO|nr:OLC1v1015420C1 [Oldenlandia corymbosa var. corymbosa]
MSLDGYDDKHESLGRKGVVKHLVKKRALKCSRVQMKKFGLKKSRKSQRCRKFKTKRLHGTAIAVMKFTDDLDEPGIVLVADSRSTFEDHDVHDNEVDVLWCDNTVKIKRLGSRYPLYFAAAGDFREGNELYGFLLSYPEVDNAQGVAQLLSEWSSLLLEGLLEDYHSFFEDPVKDEYLADDCIACVGEFLQENICYAASQDNCTGGRFSAHTLVLHQLIVCLREGLSTKFPC